MTFASGLWLPDISENKKIHEIIDIVVSSPNKIEDIFAVCKTFSTITENEHFCAFSVEKTSLQDEFTLVNVENYLTKHQYPVKVHNIGSEFLFRCKRF